MTTGKPKKLSGSTVVMCLALSAGILCVTTLFATTTTTKTAPIVEEVVEEDDRPFEEAIPSLEKPVPVDAKDWRKGATWAGSWRAASEKDGYMSGEAYIPRRLPKFDGDSTRYLTSANSVSVDPIENCTGPSYPKSYPIGKLLENWPPDTIEVPPRHFATMCRFNYQDPAQRETAFAYRDAELPFLVRNVPDVDATAKKWSSKGFLEERFGRKKYRTEKSDDNHFMYYSASLKTPPRLRGGPTDWKPPTSEVSMTYPQWLSHAKTAYNLTVLEPHYYFRVSPPDIRPSDVPIFVPPDRDEPRSLFLKDAKESKGVHCRFGAAGIVAEAHYDGSRNFVVELGGPRDHPNSGRRRYILAAPSQCHNAYLLPKGHPSGRHSQIDWSRPVDLDRYPDFQHLHAFEVILEPGDCLYIPHGWIHYIQSLGTNFQCNARSGRNDIGMSDLRKCGFRR